MSFFARLICSDPRCAEVIELACVELAELDLAGCDCCCTYELLAVSLDEPAPDPAWAERLRACRPLAAT